VPLLVARGGGAFSSSRVFPVQLQRRTPDLLSRVWQPSLMPFQSGGIGFTRLNKMVHPTK
jgi:hypothetical protein